MFAATPSAAGGSAEDRSNRGIYPTRLISTPGAGRLSSPDVRARRKTRNGATLCPDKALGTGVQPSARLISKSDKCLEMNEQLSGGHLLSAISTSIVRILRERYGRGPMKAKTYALDDIIVVVLRAGGFTAAEQTMIDSGEPERVVAMREDFQRVMAEDYKNTIEELTNRRVLAFLSNAHVEPELTLEVFFVDRPLDGFGAVEVTAPH
jgi:uncharacterized protein YbcI